MTTALVVVGILIAWWLISYLRGNPRFWHVAAKYPDAAYQWFRNDPVWVVADTPGKEPVFTRPRSDYSGPFTIFVPSLGGSRVTIYGVTDEIERSQQAFLKELEARKLIARG